MTQADGDTRDLRDDGSWAPPLNWRILAGDVREQLRELPDQSVQCCVTSPPYFNLRDYGSAHQIGQEATVSDYVSSLADVCDGVMRVLTPSGTLWINIGDSFDALLGMRLVPHRVAIELQRRGWTIHVDVVWRKTRYMPNGGDTRPVLIHEYVFMLSRARSGHYYNADAIREPHSPVSLKRWESSGVAALGGSQSMGSKAAVDGLRKHKVVANQLGKAKASVWDVCPSDYDGAHVAVMPEDLAETCILASSKQGDLVLDPFTGSGTTGAVAVRLGRSFVGCELNPAYVELAERRIGSAAPLFAMQLADDAVARGTRDRESGSRADLFSGEGSTEAGS